MILIQPSYRYIKFYTPFNCSPHQPGNYLPSPSNALSQFAITTSLLAYRPFSKLTSYSLLSLLDYEQSLFFLGPSSKTPETRTALVSRVSWLRRSRLARACTPLTESEVKERLLAVYVPPSIVFNFSCGDWNHQEKL